MIKKIFLLIILILLLTASKQECINKLNLNEIFPELNNPEFKSDSFNNIAWNSKYYNILTDFNKDGIKDLIFIGTFSPEENLADTLCFISILCLAENAKPKVDFFTTTDSKNCTVHIESNNEIFFAIDTFGFLSVKFQNGKYVSDFYQDEFFVDSKLTLMLNKQVDELVGLVFLSTRKYNHSIVWTGYTPSHKGMDSYTTIEPSDIGNVIVYPPDMSDDWQSTFEDHNEIVLLLVKTNSYIDSLANSFWGAELTDSSISDMINKIGVDNIFKTWSISNETLEKHNWILQYP